MNDIRQLLKVAAGRLYLTGFLSRLHIVALWLAGASLVAVLVQKMSPAIAIPWAWAAPALATVALALSFLLWFRTRQNENQVALVVDERLDLREKLSTALHVGDRDDVFARAAVEDAVNVARDKRTRESIRRRFPVTPPHRWWVTPVLLFLAIIASMFIPQGDLFSDESAQAPVAATVPVEVQQTLDSTVEKIRQNEELSDELKDVFEELDAKNFDPEAMKSPDSAKREAIKKLSDLSERLEKIQQEKGQTSQALKDAMQQLQSKAEDGPAKELTDALKSGNFEGAKKALEQIQAELDKGEMSDEQRQKIAEQLQQLADQMAQLAQQQKALEEALEKAGMDPNLAQNQQQLQQAIQQNQNLTQEQKQQLQQMAQAQQAANQMCQGMAGAMGQMAQGMQQGRPGQVQQAMQQMGQQLSQAEAMQQMLKQCQAMANDLAKQCNGLGQGLGQGLAMNPGGAFGQRGQGAGGEAPKAKSPTGLDETKAESKQTNAEIIASMLFEGPLVKGESQATFRDVARSAAESYADDVNDEQLPRKYHEAVQHYFGELKSKAMQTEGDSGSASEESGSGEAGSGDE